MNQGLTRTQDSLPSLFPLIHRTGFNEQANQNKFRTAEIPLAWS